MKIHLLSEGIFDDDDDLTGIELIQKEARRNVMLKLMDDELPKIEDDIKNLLGLRNPTYYKRLGPKDGIFKQCTKDFIVLSFFYDSLYLSDEVTGVRRNGVIARNTGFTEDSNPNEDLPIDHDSDKCRYFINDIRFYPNEEDFSFTLLMPMVYITECKAKFRFNVAKNKRALRKYVMTAARISSLEHDYRILQKTIEDSLSYKVPIKIVSTIYTSTAAPDVLEEYVLDTDGTFTVKNN